LMKYDDDWTDPEVFADFITSISFAEIGTATPIGYPELAIILEVQTAKGDETFNQNSGFRTFINTERVTLRNLAM